MHGAILQNNCLPSWDPGVQFVYILWLHYFNAGIQDFPQQEKRENGELMPVFKCFTRERAHMTSTYRPLARNNHIGHKLISKETVKCRGRHGIIIE